MTLMVLTAIWAVWAAEVRPGEKLHHDLHSGQTGQCRPRGRGKDGEIISCGLHIARES